MKLTLTLTPAIILTGCSAQKGTPIEFSKACDPANDGKYFEVPGYILDDGSVFCSNIGSSKVQCGFKLSDTSDGKSQMKIDIEEGTGANTVTKLESGYKKSDIRIRDSNGNEIALGKDVVKASGKVSIAPGAVSTPSVCFIQADRLDR